MQNKLANDVAYRVMEKLGFLNEFLQDAGHNLHTLFKERYYPDPSMIEMALNGTKSNLVGLGNAAHDPLAIGGVLGGAGIAQAIANPVGLKINGKDVKMSLLDKAKIYAGALLGGTAGHYIGEGAGDFAGQGITDAAMHASHAIAPNTGVPPEFINVTPRLGEGAGEYVGTIAGAALGAIPGVASKVNREMAPYIPKIKEYKRLHPEATGEEISKALGILQ